MSQGNLDLDALAEEVMGYIDDLKQGIEEDHLYSNYQKVTAYILRLTEIHNQLSLMEIRGVPVAELKKFRTMILDPTIERFEKVASYESRKITARQIEADLSR